MFSNLAIVTRSWVVLTMVCYLDKSGMCMHRDTHREFCCLFSLCVSFLLVCLFAFLFNCVVCGF